MIRSGGNVRRAFGGESTGRGPKPYTGGSGAAGAAAMKHSRAMLCGPSSWREDRSVRCPLPAYLAFSSGTTSSSLYILFRMQKRGNDCYGTVNSITGTVREPKQSTFFRAVRKLDARSRKVTSVILLGILRRTSFYAQWNCIRWYL